MIKLFLVEDEKLARDSIRENINWEEIGITFLGEASDGELALPKILEGKPDILLTDIKMPFMDGLELSRAVKNKLPEIRIIILSGHDEFDYARQAIGIGVNEYLLKPVSSRNIVKAVLKIKNEILQEREQNARSNMQDASISKLFIKALLSGYMKSTTEIIEYAQQLHIDLGANYYQVCILQLKQEEPADDIRTHLLDYIKNSGRKLCIFSQSDEDLVVLLQGDQVHQLDEDRSKILAQLKMFDLHNTHCFQEGSVENRITSISRSYQVAYRKIREEKDGVHKEKSITSENFSNLDTTVILKLLKEGTMEEITEYWKTFAEQEKDNIHSYLYRCYMYTELYYIFSKATREEGLELKDIFTGNVNIEQIVADNKTAQDYYTAAVNLSESLLSKRRKMQGRGADVIDKAKVFIHNHYMEDDLSLNTVAAHVSMSPNYFSSVFKDKTGRNFSEYLTDIRITEAKRLLRNTNLHASEIAYRVGYHNANYFSVIFKKTTGKAPSEFR